MTSPTVSSRIVGAPEDRNSALSGVMSGIRKPKPITIPAASADWITTMSGSIAPIDAMDHRSRARNPAQRLTWTGAGGGGSDDGAVRVRASCIACLLEGRDVPFEDVVGGAAGSGEGEIGVLEGRRRERIALDPARGVLGGGPGDGDVRVVRVDGEQGPPSGAHPAPHREPRVPGARVVAAGRQPQLEAQRAVVRPSQVRGRPLCEEPAAMQHDELVDD